MNLKKLININFWRFDHKHYKDLYDYDIRFNASFVIQKNYPKMYFVLTS